MTSINVDELEKAEQNQKKIMETEKKLIKKVKKAPVNRKPLPKLAVMTTEQLEEIEKQRNRMNPADEEVKKGVKSMFFKGMSLPAKDKQEVLAQRLEKSKFINHYIDNKVNFEYIDGLNDNLKFVLVYGYNYIDTVFT